MHHLAAFTHLLISRLLLLTLAPITFPHQNFYYFLEAGQETNLCLLSDRGASFRQKVPLPSLENTHSPLWTLLLLVERETLQNTMQTLASTKVVFGLQ
jgi:hypothetical protein